MLYWLLGLRTPVTVRLRTRSMMASECISKLARSQAPGVSPNSLDYSLQVRTIPAFHVHLQPRSITASECISKLARSQPPGESPNSHDHGLQVHTITACKVARSRPPRSHDHGLQMHLQIRTITASKCISKLAWLQRPSLHDHSLQVHLQTCSITALECISKFTWSRCGETLELEGRHPIINTLPHIAWHPKGIREKEWFWLEEGTKRVRGYVYI